MFNFANVGTIMITGTMYKQAAIQCLNVIVNISCE